MATDQVKVWTGQFGREYTERNRFADDEAFNRLYLERYGRARDAINEDWLREVPREARVLEIGANIGNQLRALRRIGFRRLYGVEIQRYCVEEAKRLNPEVDIIEGSGFDIPFKDGFFDLVFTNNVLIHIAPDDIGGLLDEMQRVTRRWIWGFEYYAPEFTEIPYRGHEHLLWKADYAALFRARFPALRSVREELLDCLDEPGKQDKLYLLEKAGRD
jgi:pseudaminic acid biosynthesis-associated methylase